MRILALILFACTASPAYTQQQAELPKDGNGLLEYCNVVIDVLDSPASISSQSSDRITEQMRKFGWCTGYLQATEDALSLTEVHIALMVVGGVTFSGPDKAKLAALDSLLPVCITEKVPIAQSARVLVKWLRDHPERLHEPDSILTMAALKDAFPCHHSIPKEAAKPTAVKP